jgi:hypothetical protein
VLVAIDTGTRRPVKILRARPTRHFLFLLIRCRCGKKFGHRADRPTIVCYHCGRMAALRELGGRRGKKGGSGPVRPGGARGSSQTKRSVKPPRPIKSAPRATSRRASVSGRRTVSAPAKRQALR